MFTRCLHFMCFMFYQNVTHQFSLNVFSNNKLIERNKVSTGEDLLHIFFSVDPNVEFSIQHTVYIQVNSAQNRVYFTALPTKSFNYFHH